MLGTILLLTIVFAVIAIAIFDWWHFRDRPDWRGIWSFPVAIAGGLVLVLVGASVVLVPYTSQVKDNVTLQGFDERINIAQARADDLSAILRTELEKYPEIERELIGNLDPAIILNFPVLKSNETITTLAMSLAEIEDREYSLATERVNTLERMMHRNVNPWVVRGWWWNDYGIDLSELR